MDSLKNDTQISFASYSPKAAKPEVINSTKAISQSASPVKTRDPNGLEMFYLMQSKKNAIKEIEIVNNRISQLIKTEEKAKKKIEIAQRKAEQIQKAKERHNLDVKDKELQKEIRKIEEEQIRKKNREDKIRRVDNIKSYQDMIFKDRQINAKEIKDRSKEHDALHKQFRTVVEQQKNEKKVSRYTEASEHKQRKGVNVSSYQQQLKEEYEKRIATEKAAHLDLLNKKKELEKYESQIVSRLANTEQTQNEALKNLEALAKVSLFHLGLRL